jgi:hypothetical protein
VWAWKGLQNATFSPSGGGDARWRAPSSYVTTTPKQDESWPASQESVIVLSDGTTESSLSVFPFHLGEEPVHVAGSSSF